jgi:hypothetical protein
MTEKQVHVRYHLGWLSILGAFGSAFSLDDASMVVVPTGLWFLFGTAIALIMALTNEARRAGVTRRQI